jgi:4-diphosphocytidyl-2-C-methyl-D-erythritol kinase
MKIRANAKINLFLDIIKKREDGYHNIETVFQEIDFFDELDIELIDKGFRLTCNIKELETDDNLLRRAFDVVYPYFNKKIGIKVHLEKFVPFGAGLGGGSSDCANFINSLLSLTKSHISEEDLYPLGAKLGADVPFFFKGGSAIGRGIGDELEQIPVKTVLNLLIVNPNIHVSTKEAYSGCVIGGGGNNLHEVTKGLKTGDIERVARYLYNGFENTVLKKYPEIQELKDLINKCGAIGALMSGSGSTCFGIFENEDKAKSAYDTISKKTSYFTRFVESIIR